MRLKFTVRVDSHASGDITRFQQSHGSEESQHDLQSEENHKSQATSSLVDRESRFLIGIPTTGFSIPHVLVYLVGPPPTPSPPPRDAHSPQSRSEFLGNVSRSYMTKLREKERWKGREKGNLTALIDMIVSSKRGICVFSKRFPRDRLDEC